MWIDEVLFGVWVRDGGYSQEFIPIWIAQIFGAHTEFGLRALSATCGTLTVPAVYWVTRRWESALLVSVFPLFVFWSRMARPYAVAGLFVVLAWKHWAWYIPALLTTPVSLIGVRVTKRFLVEKWYWVALLAIGALVFFFIRPDWERFDFGYWKHSRLWYIPALAGVLYLSEFVESRVRRK